METKTKGKGKEKVVPLGLIYDAQGQKFERVYKDLASNEIQIGPIGPSGDQEGQEVNTSISAA